eukprot:162239-Chlamydomonas_euryale.AAC.3
MSVSQVSAGPAADAVALMLSTERWRTSDASRPAAGSASSTTPYSAERLVCSSRLAMVASARLTPLTAATLSGTTT